MAIQCPKCRRGIPRWQLIGLVRLFSISCPHCHSLVSIDGRGRIALIATILVSILLGGFLQRITGFELVLPAAVVAGTVAGCVVSPRVGRLGISPEEPEDQHEI